MRVLKISANIPKSERYLNNTLQVFLKCEKQDKQDKLNKRKWDE